MGCCSSNESTRTKLESTLSNELKDPLVDRPNRGSSYSKQDGVDSPNKDDSSSPRRAQRVNVGVAGSTPKEVKVKTNWYFDRTFFTNNRILQS